MRYYKNFFAANFFRALISSARCCRGPKTRSSFWSTALELSESTTAVSRESALYASRYSRGKSAEGVRHGVARVEKSPRVIGPVQAARGPIRSKLSSVWRVSGKQRASGLPARETLSHQQAGRCLHQGQHMRARKRSSRMIRRLVCSRTSAPPLRPSAGSFFAQLSALPDCHRSRTRVPQAPADPGC